MRGRINRSPRFVKAPTPPHIPKMSEQTSSGRALVPYNERKLKRDEKRVGRGFWPKVRRLIFRLPFMDELLAAYFAATDTATPAYVKAVLMAALAYFVLPLDMVPDFIAGFGFTDDASVLLAAIHTVKGHITDAHRQRAQRALEELKDEQT